MAEIKRVLRNSEQYPTSLINCLGKDAPGAFNAIGNLDILRTRKLAIFSSTKCPGSLILMTHDFAQHLRKTEITIISGFHSPMEEECLIVLLRGTHPLIICPARSIEGMRMRAEYKRPLEAGRLLLLSPFTKSHKRNTKETSFMRNRFAAALAEQVLIAHADQGSRTENLCSEILAWDKPVYTFQGMLQKKHDNFKSISADYVTAGWQATCKCNTSEVVPATILDPFAGAGTTLMVANRFGRSAIGIELNPATIEIASRRIQADIEARANATPVKEKRARKAKAIVPINNIEQFVLQIFREKAHGLLAVG